MKKRLEELRSRLEVMHKRREDPEMCRGVALEMRFLEEWIGKLEMLLINEREMIKKWPDGEQHNFHLGKIAAIHWILEN